MVQTLEELKAENAKAEQEAQAQTASVDVEQEAEATEVEPQELEEVAEPNQADGEETEVESWMLSDEQQSEDGHEVAAQVRRKWKTKLADEKEKTSQLEDKIAQLEAQLNSGQAPQQSELSRPKRPNLSDDGIDYDDDKFNKAMDKYEDDLEAYRASQLDSRISANQKSAQLEQQQQLHKQQIDQSVKDHLLRAEKLAEHNIDADAYQNAELNVRRMIDSVAPGSGDAIADNLIHSLGEGSEKLFYQIGINATHRNEIQRRLQSDQSGTSALLYIGELKGKMNSLVKRKSSAPKPAANADGGETGATGEAAFKRKYSRAKSAQERFKIAQEAKQAGVSKQIINQW